jgi:cold shock CspA family protein
VLFTSSVNTTFPRKIRVVSVSEKDTIRYVPVLCQPRQPEVEKEEDSFNLLVLDRLSAKFKLVHNSNQTTEMSIIKPEAVQDLRHLASMYEPEIARYLNLTSLMDYHLTKSQRNEVALSHQEEITSAQKQLTEVYHQYAKSVGVDKVLEKQKLGGEPGAGTPRDLRKRSFPDETPSQYDANLKDELPIDQVSIVKLADSFPNRVDSSLRFDFFLGQKPPGLSRPVMYINSTKVKKVLNEKILQSNAMPKVEEQPVNMTVEKSQDFLMDKIKELKSVLSPERKKPVVILEDRKDQYRGRLKFFNEDNNYGFITIEDTEEDVFVYHDELAKANLSGKDFRVVKDGKKLRVRFQVVSYIGRKGKSKKAVDLKVIEEEIPKLTDEQPRRPKIDSM